MSIYEIYRQGKEKKGAPQRTPNPNRETNLACPMHPKNAADKYWVRSMVKPSGKLLI
jgi:hypothetical protein